MRWQECSVCVQLWLCRIYNAITTNKYQSFASSQHLVVRPKEVHHLFSWMAFKEPGTNKMKRMSIVVTLIQRLPWSVCSCSLLNIPLLLCTHTHSHHGYLWLSSLCSALVALQMSFDWIDATRHFILEYYTYYDICPMNNIKSIDYTNNSFVRDHHFILVNARHIFYFHFFTRYNTSTSICPTVRTFSTFTKYRSKVKWK